MTRCGHETPVPDCHGCLRAALHRAARARHREPAALAAAAVAREGRWRAVEAEAAARAKPGGTPVGPCVHRGAALRMAPCAAGPNCGKVEVKACTLHGQCTDHAEKSTRGVKQCRHCKDATPSMPSRPREFAPGLVDPIQTPRGERSRGWPWLPEVRDEHVSGLLEVVKATEGIVPPRRSGQGILIVGGGKYWIGAVIACRLLREVGYAGPIKAWYRGRSEPIDASQVEGLNVELTDADEFAARMPLHERPRLLHGWGCKTFAVMHCGLHDVIYQDADAYWTRDPSPLLGLLREAPFAYWQDHSWNVWGPYHGLTPDRVGAVPPVQSGQMIIDVVGYWRQLVIAHWIDQHSDYFYPHGTEPRKYWHQFGDQNSHDVAIIHTGGRFLKIGNARWRYPAFTYEHAGEIVMVHRCEAKFFPGTKPHRDDSLPLEGRAWELFHELTSGSVLGA